MSLPFHPQLRRTAALLAWVGLLAMPARGIMACPMPAEAAVVEQDHSDHSDHADHAGHVEQAEQVPEQSHHLPGAPDSPCVDLAHCAVAAVPIPTRALDAVRPPMLRTASPPRVAPSAPPRTVEPPPPRA